jgi:hypothetical protein
MTDQTFDDAVNAAHSDTMKLPPGSVLNPDYHDRLIAGMKSFCAEANISPHYVHESAVGNIPNELLTWLKSIKNPEGNGVGVSLSSDDPTTVCAYMAGAVLRNHISVQVTTLQSFIKTVEAGDASRYSCLLIPNFCTAGSLDGIPDWKKALIEDGLQQRINASKQTVVVYSSLPAVKTGYGGQIHYLLSQTFHTADL